jgi:hypothetical protein
MGIRAWWHRSKDDEGERSRKRLDRKPSAIRHRNRAAGQGPRRPRQEQYDSEFITRYGDPFD